MLPWHGRLGGHVAHLLPPLSLFLLPHSWIVFDVYLAPVPTQPAAADRRIADKRSGPKRIDACRTLPTLFLFLLEEGIEPGPPETDGRVPDIPATAVSPPAISRRVPRTTVDWSRPE